MARPLVPSAELEPIMSSPAGNSAAARGRPRNLGLLAVLVLAPLLSVALSVLLVLIILHFLASIPGSAVANGTVADPSLMRDVVVTEITPQGFKWAHPGSKSPATNSTTTTSWTVRGVPDLTPGKSADKK
jgi:hypothetical protein